MSSFQDKIYNYEVTPPGNLWNKIAAALDKPEMADDFSSKIYNIETIPPVSAWEKIKFSLEEQHEAADSKQRKKSLLYRYAAAAIIIGLIVFGATMWLNNGLVKKTAKENISFIKDTVTASHNEKMTLSNNNSAESEAARNDAALEDSKKTFAKLDKSERNKIKKNIITPADLMVVSNSEESDPDSDYAGIESSGTHDKIYSNFADRYINVMTPEGNNIRMSKKWGDLACSVSGEEQDENCKDQLQKWREKIACSPLSPSSGNFLDIISLINSLKENNP